MGELIKLKKIYLLTTIVLLTACSGKGDLEAYQDSIEGGLDAFAAGNYDKAEVHFESALSQNEKDDWAESLMEQTSNYKEAKALQEEEKYEEAIEKAEEVITNKEGSEAIAEKAKRLIDESQDKIDGVLSFEDFTGYYLHFSEEDPSIADMLLTISEKEMRFYYWRSDYFIDEILSKKIEEDELSLELYKEANEQVSEEYTRAKFQYIESEDEVKLLNNDLIYHKVPYEVLEKYDFVIEDIVNE